MKPTRTLPSLPLLAALLALLLSAGLVLLGIWEWRQFTHQLQQRQALQARVLADQAARSVDAAAQAGAQLIESWNRTPHTPTQLQDSLREALAFQPGVRALGLLDAEGRIVASTRPAEVGLRIPLERLDSPGRAPGQAWLGPVLAARGLGDLAAGARPVPPGVSLLPLLQPLPPSAGRARLLVTQINTDLFATFQAVTLEGEPTHTALLDLQGHWIAGLDSAAARPPASWKTLPVFRHFPSEQESGSWQGEGLREGAQRVSFRLAPRWPLLALVETSRSDALRLWRAESGKLLLICALAGLLGIAALFALVRIQSARRRALAQRDLAQAAVRERDEALTLIVGSLQETVFRTDAGGELLFASEQAEVLSGQALAQLLGRPIWELVEPPERHRLQALLRAEAARSEEPEARPAPLHRMLVGLRRRSDGRLLHVDLSLRAVRRDGQLVGFAGSAVDASARVQAQRLLEAQLGFVQQMLEVSPLPTSVFDLQRRYVFVNQAWERFTGRDRDQVLGTRVGSGLDTAQRELHESMDQQLLAAGRPLRYDARLRRADGSMRDVIVNKLLLPGDTQSGTRIMAKLFDVTELREAERATLEARDAAEEASRAKSEFVANISHELRTPLQSIIGFSELGELRSREQPRLQAMFGDIHAAGQRMLSLVNDLLDVAKLDSAIGAIHLERCELRSLLRGVAHELDPLLQARQLELAMEPLEQALPLHADPLRLQQVLRNLLANAIKFSPQGTRLQVLAEEHGELLRVSVLDQGPGVPEAELERIFDAFTQSSRTQDGSGGTGLGLTISRKIVEAHGGRLWAQNRAEGGACFRLELPRRPQGQAQTQPMPL